MVNQLIKRFLIGMDPEYPILCYFNAMHIPIFVTSILILSSFATMPRPVMRSTQPPIQWILRVLTLGLEQLGHEADDSPPSSAEVKNVQSYTSTYPIHLHSVVLS